MFIATLVSGTPSQALPSITAEKALSRYCEPLIAGSPASKVTATAKADGLKEEQIGGRPFLRVGELLLGLSDVPRVCIVQAPAGMTFVQGSAVVDAWAARHPGAMRGLATKGPDGAPVRAWAAPKQGKSLLVSEQINGLGNKVLAFILAPLPSS
jgi:hypothetical protein